MPNLETTACAPVNTAEGTESQRIPVPIGGGAVIGEGYPEQQFFAESDSRGLNELRRRLRDRLRWSEESVRKTKIALELLEDDEAYSIYESIASAR